MTKALVVMTCLIAMACGISLWMRHAVTPGDVMRSYAADAVAQSKTRPVVAAGGAVLDFSEESLEILDRILDAEKAEGPRLEVLAKVWGAYFGEVIRRQHGGEWVDGKNGYVLAVKGLQVEVVAVARARLAKSGEPLERVYAGLLRGWSSPFGE